MSPVLFVVGLVAAFTVGFTAGRISGAIALEKDPTREVAVDVKAVSGKFDRFSRGHWPLTLTCFVLIIVGVTTGISAQQHSNDSARIQALTECVATYENQLSGALPPVRDASKRNDDADIEFKRAVLRLFVPGANKKDATAVKVALAHNIRVYDHLNRVRAIYPYPTPPKKVCPHE